MINAEPSTASDIVKALLAAGVTSPIVMLNSAIDYRKDDYLVSSEQVYFLDKPIKAAELMEQGYLSPVKIYQHHLHYTSNKADQVKLWCRCAEYQLSDFIFTDAAKKDRVPLEPTLLGTDCVQAAALPIADNPPASSPATLPVKADCTAFIRPLPAPIKAP